MSRSYKHNPYTSWVLNPKGTKQYKRAARKAYRASCKAAILAEQYDLLPDELAYGDEWMSPRDGKQRLDEKRLGTDYFKKLLRK